MNESFIHSSCWRMSWSQVFFGGGGALVPFSVKGSCHSRPYKHAYSLHGLMLDLFASMSCHERDRGSTWPIAFCLSASFKVVEFDTDRSAWAYL